MSVLIHCTVHTRKPPVQVPIHTNTPCLHSIAGTCTVKQPTQPVTRKNKSQQKPTKANKSQPPPQAPQTEPQISSLCTGLLARGVQPIS